MYRLIKPTPGEEKYFSLFYIRSFRIAYTQFRTNVLPININIKRFSKDKDTLNCIFCVDEIEDVHHFMIKCPMYLDLRLRFLPNKNLTIRNLLLCSCDDTRIGIGKYIYYAHKKKKTYKKWCENLIEITLMISWNCNLYVLGSMAKSLIKICHFVTLYQKWSL